MRASSVKFCTAFLITYSLALGTSGHSCQPDPCQNGGTCLAGVSSDPYYCICMDGFTGKDCNEVEQGPCHPNPCQNGGLCELMSRRGDVFGEYVCKCPTGFQGIHCQTNIDDCSSQPCINGGQCVDLDADFSCHCPSPYVGKSCQHTCASALGMEGGAIDDHQISASSLHLGFLGLKRWRPELARLNNKGIVNAWSMATFDLNPWFQVLSPSEYFHSE
ncbi:hypothetical protein chiPu_0004044 [Chiloscyllium punctatum]|uniref:Delta-like protein n=1 Tax=Chiloscyllium punctatum TaxID=137246 RepID=A0A401S5F3_CHIPU|nr:hypothetical protein [Chiloscyllium punctatum]